MIRFKKAFKVTANDKTLSKQHNALAEAFNSRILSGIGDCAWRIFYYAYSTFRGLRNPNGNDYPPQDEWFKFYAYMEPKSTYGRFGWPQAPAGEPEGANTSNPFMAWIFGNDSRVRKSNGERDLTEDRIHGFWSEAVRLGGLELDFPTTDGSLTKHSGHPLLARVWFDSQFQRGSCAFISDYKYLDGFGDTQTKELQLVSQGISGAARRHLRYVMEAVSMGRYAPSYVPNPAGQGGVFRKKNAVKDQVQQAMFHYLSYFRGVEDERAKHNKIHPTVRTKGFNFELFFAKQFLLAPNYSKPVYEKDDNGDVITDSIGNKKIKYDSIGYPELTNETKTFSWSKALNNSNSLNYAKCASDTDLENSKEGGPGLLKAGDDITFDTNPEPKVNKDRFCVSALYIQTSDIAVLATDNPDDLLRNFSIDVYLEDKFYVNIPIDSICRYEITERSGASANGFNGQPNRYQIYQYNKIYYFPYPLKGKITFVVRATGTGLLNIGRKIQDPATGTPTYALDNFSVYVKPAHVIEMKPTVADAYVLMRLATTEGKGSNAGQMDPVGHFGGDNCKKAFNNYYKFGVAYNLRGESSLYNNTTYVSANPIYESTRKFITKNIKMADRVTLVDYEVNDNGESVLYFKRFAYGMKNTGIDIFRGLGPSITQVGNRAMVGSDIEEFIPIAKNKNYIVLDLDENNQDGYILYRIFDSQNKPQIVKYTHGQTLIGGDYYYASYFSKDSVGIYELDGIRLSDRNLDKPIIEEESKQKISPDGKNEQYANGNTSNEWTMFMTSNMYHWSYSSEWKPEMYGDIMGALNSRCLTSSHALEYYTQTSKNVKKNIANVTWRIGSLPLITESPSAYNFIENANTDMSKAGTLDAEYARNFAKSCPVYQKPYKLKSTERLNKYSPRSRIIKVTLNTRLNPATVNGNAISIKGKVSENLSAFANASNSFDYRTDESSVIDYILHASINRQCQKGKIGDVSLDNNFFWKKYSPFGCCYPRFYFVKLIPLVSKETVMYSDHYNQMEYYLRAMCNGFLNPDSEMSTAEIERIINEGLTGVDLTQGYDSAVGDYLFEDLMRKSYDISTKNYRPITPDNTIRY